MKYMPKQKLKYAKKAEGDVTVGVIMDISSHNLENESKILFKKEVVLAQPLLYGRSIHSLKMLQKNIHAIKF